VNSDTLRLGRTDLEVSSLGIGTWAWGDRWIWGYGRGDYTDKDIREAFEISLDAGVNTFDTAEVYGLGRSESLLGASIRDRDTRPIVMTKFMPLPWRLRKQGLHRALSKSLDRLGLDRVDLYQIHVPLPPVPVETWMEAMAEAVASGQIRAVGVSNYSAKQMGRAHNALAAHDIPLASNQVHYSLLHRQPEFNGVKQLCHDLDITLIAYSPLEQGILTGKYTSDNPPPGIRGRQYNARYLANVQPLLERLREIGEAHGGKTPAQVALNWTICKGTMPIPGAKNARHARSNAGAMGWRLSDEEVAALDTLSLEVNSPSIDRS
jgi:aryl-alcohol dehydrogenase-like predicted oxidoreductase